MTGTITNVTCGMVPDYLVDQGPDVTRLDQREPPDRLAAPLLGGGPWVVSASISAPPTLWSATPGAGSCSTGRARLVTVAVDEVLDAVRPVAEAIIQALAACLEHLPAQGVGDVTADGVPLRWWLDTGKRLVEQQAVVGVVLAMTDRVGPVGVGRRTSADGGPTS
jgi:hypothetical protein